MNFPFVVFCDHISSVASKLWLIQYFQRLITYCLLFQTILTLFGLPSHIIDMKREHALETAKAKLLEDSTKEESATDARGDGEDEDEEENDDEEEEEEERKSVKEDEPPKDPISNAECVEDTHAESS